MNANVLNKSRFQWGLFFVGRSFFNLICFKISNSLLVNISHQCFTDELSIIKNWISQTLASTNCIYCLTNFNKPVLLLLFSLNIYTPVASPLISMSVSPCCNSCCWIVFPCKFNISIVDFC
jgi:hypothetical protein